MICTHRAFALLTLLAAPGNGAPTAPVVGDSSSVDPAAAFVEHFNWGTGLQPLAAQLAHGTTTFGTFVLQHGAAAEESRVAAEIAKALAKYQGRWHQHLAAVYAKHLPETELRSLMAQGNTSPYTGKSQATQVRSRQKCVTHRQAC